MPKMKPPHWGLNVHASVFQCSPNKDKHASPPHLWTCGWYGQVPEHCRNPKQGMLGQQDKENAGIIYVYKFLWVFARLKLWIIFEIFGHICSTVFLAKLVLILLVSCAFIINDKIYIFWVRYCDIIDSGQLCKNIWSCFPRYPTSSSIYIVRISCLIFTLIVSCF